MLVYRSPDDLRAEPDARRFWVLAVLLALREKATRVEVRFGDGDAMLYHRVDGRDWELAAVSAELFPAIKPALREAARLVAPERPGTTILAGLPGGRVEAQEIGWLTFDLDQRLIDLAVRVDPREPYGFIQIDVEYPEEAELSGLAGQALDAYYDVDGEDG